MKKTLAQLKRDAKSGNLFAKMIIRNGNTDIPEKMKEIRQVIDSNSSGIKFLNPDGKKSELRIECASLVEYTDTHLTIYVPGLRDLTPEEIDIMNMYEVSRDKKQEEMDALTDGNLSYWRRNKLFTELGYEYLLGHETKEGKKYDFNTGKIYDNRIKGEVLMKYEIVQK